MLQIIDRVVIVAERIERGRLRLRHDEHVALVDPLPAADARAVEPQAVLEHVLGQLVDRDREVLPQAGEVHEPQVDRLDVLLATQGQYFFWESQAPPFRERGHGWRYVTAPAWHGCLEADDTSIQDGRFLQSQCHWQVSP